MSVFDSDYNEDDLYEFSAKSPREEIDECRELFRRGDIYNSVERIENTIQISTDSLSTTPALSIFAKNVLTSS